MSGNVRQRGFMGEGQERKGACVMGLKGEQHGAPWGRRCAMAASWWEKAPIEQSMEYAPRNTPISRIKKGGFLIEAVLYLTLGIAGLMSLPLAAEENLERLAAAEARLAQAEAVHGPQHLETGARLNDLAHIYYRMGQYAKAEPLYTRALAITEKAAGLEHPSTGTSINNLANSYYGMGEYAKAERLYLQALEIAVKTDERGLRVAGQSPRTDFTANAAAPFAHPYYWAPFVLMGNWL